MHTRIMERNLYTYLWQKENVCDTDFSHRKKFCGHLTIKNASLKNSRKIWPKYSKLVSIRLE